MSRLFILLGVVLVVAGCYERTEQTQETGTVRSVTKTTERVEGTDHGQPTDLRRTTFAETLSESEARRDMQASVQVQPVAAVEGLFGLESGSLMAIIAALIGGPAGGYLLARKGKAKKAVPA